MSDYTGFTSNREPLSPVSPLEAYLTERHGDLHTVIPDLFHRLQSHEAVAKELSRAGRRISTSWVRDWIISNGYTVVKRVERAS